MVNVIKVEIKGRLTKTTKALKGFHTKLPQLTSEGMNKWGKVLERDMKSSARRAGIKPFTGTIYKKGIEWRQKPKGRTGRLFIRQYAVFLDSMRPHFVNLTQNRTTLLRWAGQANLEIRTAAAEVSLGLKKKNPIFVRPHPFIRSGFKVARPKLLPILKQQIKRARRGG